MAATFERPKPDATITIRIPARTLELIDSAAAFQGKLRREFMVESARLHAVDVLLDQRVFALDADQSAAIFDALANPAKSTDALRELMREGAVGVVEFEPGARSYAAPGTITADHQIDGFDCGKWLDAILDEPNVGEMRSAGNWAELSSSIAGKSICADIYR
jgi:uncharacterized protein (DUF1778 family)